MPKILKYLAIVILHIQCFWVPASLAENIPSHLVEWAHDNPVVRIGVDSTFPPFDYVDEDGVTQGAARIIRDQLSIELPVNLEESSISDFRSEYRALLRGDIDAISACGDTPKRKGEVLFTKPYLQMTPIIVVNVKGSIQSELDILPEHDIASISGYADTDYAEKLSLNHSSVDSNLQGYQAIENGEFDGFVTYLYLYKYMVKKYQFTQIKPIAISQFESLPIGFCVNKNKPMLVELLNWGIDHLGDDFVLAMQSKWALTIHDDRTTLGRKVERGVGLEKTLLYSVLLVTFVLFIAKRFASIIAIKLDTFAFRVTFFTVLALILIISSVSIYFFLKGYKEQILTEQKQNFNITRDVTRKTLASWYTDRELLTHNIAESESFIRLVSALVKAKENGTSEQIRQSNQKLRDYFSNRPYTTQGGRAYTIMNTQGRYILNFVKSVEGQLSPLKQQRPELFNKVVKGKTEFIPAVWSNVDIDNKLRNGDKDAEVFIATPVKDFQGNVIAVLGFRFDPDREFSQLFIDARLGDTFESYGVDANGYMVSSSRFTQDLQQKGVVPPGESSVLHVRLPEPDTNAIVQAAKFKLSGQNLVGYKNYLGKTVVGQWISMKRANFTVVSEIELSEVLAEYYSVRKLLLVGLMISMAIILSISIFMITISQRANDISRRSQKELTDEVDLRTKELKDSEQRNKLINSSVADGIIGLDKKGQLIFANESATNITGYSESEFLASNIITLFAGENQRNIRFEDTVIFESIVSKKVIRVENETVSMKGGKTLPIEYSISPVEDEASDFACVIAMKDITLRLQETERLEKMLENLPACMVIMNQDDEVEQINQTGVELLGFERDEIIGKSVSAFIPEEQLESHKALLRKFYEEKVVIDTRTMDKDFKVKHKSGRLIEIQAVYTPIQFYNGLYAAVMVRDITVEKQAEESLIEAKRISDDASKAKSDFLANMSHEIRTPMNAIMGMSHLALGCKLDRKPHNYVTKVYKAAESLLGIINDILDFSKIEAGKLDIEYVEFNLHDTFADLANIITIKAAEKDLELLFDISEDVPVMLIGDPLRLNQILINLAGNAVKFTEQGQVIISVSVVENAEHCNANDICLVFSVKDSGIGMSDEQQKKLFKSFSQADSSTTRKYGGTGLGLTISKKLVELMQGEISLTSKLGEGSNFTFTTILQRSENVDFSLIEKQSSFLADKRILIVDDNPLALDVLSSILKSFHCQVIMANSGKEAIELVSQAVVNFDFIMLDWKMPDLDGLETYEIIKSKYPYKDQQFIMVTSNANDIEVLESLKRQIESVIVKPVTSSSLFDELISLTGEEAFTNTREMKRDDEFLQNKLSLQGAKILLVEDNDLNQELAIELLNQANINIELAENGAIAVEKFSSETFDGILMDLQMPVMDGFTATKIIREKDLNIPIIAMTANAMVSDKEKVLEAGMNDHITKPINVNAMFATIAKWISPSVTPVAITPSSNHQDEHPIVIEEVILPRFESIDVTAGLAVANDNKELYIKLLKRFVTGQSDFSERFEQSITANNQEESTRFAHTLKGSAGNIGAKTLQRVTQTLELACAGSFENGAIKQALPPVIENLTLVLSEITTYFDRLDVKEKAQSNEGTVNDFSFTDELKVRLTELLELVEDFETESLEHAVLILAELKGSQHQGYFEKVCEKIEAYEFSEAEELLNEFIKLSED